ncbi:MAG: hypothetical protein U0X20_20915 [Caldilineaceae bacterium]
MPVVKSTTDRPSAAADPLATPLAASLGRHGMAVPALLYVTAHRPLAFAAGHLLAVAAPVAAVLGAPYLLNWAQLLTSPEGVDRLVAALAAADKTATTGLGEQHV